MSLYPSQWLDSVDSLSGVHLWFRAIFGSTCVSSPTIYLVLRCHFGSSAFACKTHPPSRTSLRSFTTGVPLAEESVLSFSSLSVPRGVGPGRYSVAAPLVSDQRGPRLLWPRSQFHGYRDGAGCWFLLFHRPTLARPLSPSHVLRGHCGVWECVLVIAKEYRMR